VAAEENLQEFRWNPATPGYTETVGKMIREELDEDIKELCRYILKEHEALANFTNGFRAKKSTCNCPDCHRARRILRSYGEDI